MQVFVSEPFDAGRLRAAEERAARAEAALGVVEEARTLLQWQLKEAQAAQVAAQSALVRAEARAAAAVAAAAAAAAAADAVDGRPERREAVDAEARMVEGNSTCVHALPGVADDGCSIVAAVSASHRALPVAGVSRGLDEGLPVEDAGVCLRRDAAIFFSADEEQWMFEVEGFEHAAVELTSDREGASQKRRREEEDEGGPEPAPWRKCQMAWSEQESLVIVVDD